MMRFFRKSPVTKDDLHAEAQPLRDAGFTVACEGNGDWRCAHCERLRLEAYPMVWVPEATRGNDPLWMVLQSLKGNDDMSGWCVPCALKLLKNV